MNFIDLKSQQKRLASDINNKISNVLSHGAYVMGPEVSELEYALADYTGVKHVISSASGTDALLMSLMAKGIGTGDAILTTPFTFVATAEVISLLGATPVFVDIDETYNIDPQKLQSAYQEAKDGGLTVKGIMPVDLFGLPADYRAIEKFAKEKKLFILEDACQGFGGEFSGKKLCSFGEMAATSFYPAKPLGCYGDGGAVFTNDDSLAQLLTSIRIHGMGKSQYDNVRLGITGRLDTIQAAILLAKLAIFDDELSARRKLAEKYSKGLSRVVTTPPVPSGSKSAWAQYSILSPNREVVREKLSKAGIPTAVYYPKPMHLQDAYKYLGYKEGDFIASEKVSKEIFSLPMHPYLTDEESDKVIEEVKKAVG